MGISTLAPTSPKPSHQQNITIISMTGNFLLLFLLSLNGNITYKEPPTLSLLSLIIKISPTSKILTNFLIIKPVGLYFSKTSILNELSLLALRWALQMLSLTRMVLTLPLTTMPLPSSLIPSLSMPWILPYPNLLQHPPPLIPLSFESSLPCIRVSHCALIPPSLTGILTMNIYTLRVACTSLLLLALSSSPLSIPLPPLATWASFTQRPSFVKNFVDECTICQQNKVNTHPTIPPLIPIPLSQLLPFKQISIDLITDLPPSDGHDFVMVVVDHGLMKGVILTPCSKTIDAAGITQIFLNNIFKCFGLHDMLISN